MMKKIFLLSLCFLTILLGMSGCTNNDIKENTSQEKQNEIHFNHMEIIPSSLVNIELHVEDFEKIDREELVTYYGVNIFPKVPSDLRLSENQYGFYKRNGEIYYDGNVVNYANEDFTKSVSLEVSKAQFTPSDVSQIFGDDYQQSLINGVKVCLGLTDDQYYYAEFTCQKVGFRIIADGLSQEEFISVIQFLV